jgi:hypothetical protein
MKRVNLLKFWLVTAAILILALSIIVLEEVNQFRSREAFLEGVVPFVGIAFGALLSITVGCLLVAGIREGKLPKWMAIGAQILVGFFGFPLPMFFSSVVSSLTPPDEHGLRLFHGEHGWAILGAQMMMFWVVISILVFFSIWIIRTKHKVPNLAAPG